MRNFLKMFLAAILALIVFCLISFFFFIGWVGALAAADKVKVGPKAVLVVDLSEPFPEKMQSNPLADLGFEDQYDKPGIFDVVRMIRKASNDSAVKGIFIKANTNSNGFAGSEEIRNAILEFKGTGKFVYAHGDVISQKAYYVSSVADKIYCNPKGALDWRGLAVQMLFLKGTLQKLEIEPQIFYAGKFKSATEPFRETKMTEPNRVQTTEIVSDIYNHFLQNISAARKIDTATLRRLADANMVQFAADAVTHKLVDGLKYDDEVKEEMRIRLKLDKDANINFVPLEKYAKAVNFRTSGKDRIAIIYAQGDIVYGKGEDGQIGSNTYAGLIRKARTDKNVKAIVLRVNSGGGSSLASENIWREMTLARKEKPVIVSFGDVAASGGYYIACHADSIFAQPNTITGSIGVFAMIPNMQKFFDHKLGVTFDGVSTGPNAEELNVTKPLTAAQRTYIQSEVDTIYHDFKTRVADGRKLNMAFVDSIGQGRIWSGQRAVDLQLVDRLGGVQDAVDCAARMANVKTFRVKEFPETKGIFERFFGGYQQTYKTRAIKEELGEENMKLYSTIRRIKMMMNSTQARLPFDLIVE
ncbi:MAG TPA: signal peptide peptidase SppA [Chitinophagaceae bacterium]